MLKPGTKGGLGNETWLPASQDLAMSHSSGGQLQMPGVGSLITPDLQTVHLRRLAYFVATAEEHHFGRAAARLYLAEPSLSTGIAALERGVGTALFWRDSRHVTLLEPGAFLLPRARALLAEHQTVLSELRALYI